jgi:hypothetical protein
VTRHQPDQLRRLGDLQDPEDLAAAPGQAERGPAGGGLLVGVEEQVQAAEVEEGYCGQVDDQGLAAAAGVEEFIQAGGQGRRGGPVEFAADVDYRGVGALPVQVEQQWCRGRPGLNGAGRAVVAGHGPGPLRPCQRWPWEGRGDRSRGDGLASKPQKCRRCSGPRQALRVSAIPEYSRWTSRFYSKTRNDTP